MDGRCIFIKKGGAKMNIAFKEQSVTEFVREQENIFRLAAKRLGLNDDDEKLKRVLVRLRGYKKCAVEAGIE